MRKTTRARIPLTVKLFLTMLCLLALLLVFQWVLNTFALNTYYIHEKSNFLEQAFYSLSEQSISGLTAALTEELSVMNTKGNIRITLWDEQSRLVYDSRPGSGKYEPTMGYPALSVQAGEYQIETLREDGNLPGGDLRLIGRFANGYAVIMSTPVAAMQESVAISNRFLAISGSVTLAVSCLLVFWYARNFSRPIRELSCVAGQISRLDFTNTYTVCRNDELGDLGDSIQVMSRTLQATIAHLQEANRQLTDENVRTMRQNEAQKAFIANVSHELKTPIALIQTYAEGLQENITTDEQSRTYYSGVIADEAASMGKILEKMTLLMQIESGDDALALDRCDIAGLLSSVTELYRPLLKERAVTVEQDYAEPLYVWADASLMEHVLGNYLSNALHYVPPHGRIRLTIRPAEKERIRIAIFNSGSPLPQEELPHVWERFYKVDKSRARAYGGTGIGLALVAAVMQAHRMPYGVCNYDDGVEFYIELPISQ